MIVLLLQPKTLRRLNEESYYGVFLDSCFFGQDISEAADGAMSIQSFVGLQGFKSRVVSRVIPIPLPGNYGRVYGFTKVLWNQMTAKAGSANDPGQYRFSAVSEVSEYRISPYMERLGRQVRDDFPKEIRWVAGMTPIPEDIAPQQYVSIHAQRLLEWGACVGCDTVLTNLPAVLPGRYFASESHLNQTGIRLYSRELVSFLSK